jgi:uncharacterized protein with GYD domain
MPKYLGKVTLGAEAVQLLRKEKGSGRRAAVTKAIEAAGGKVEAFYFAYGEADTIIITDFPDTVSSVAVSLLANTPGIVRVSMMPLITVEEMDRAVDKAATLPSPAGR